LRCCRVANNEPVHDVKRDVTQFEPDEHKERSPDSRVPVPPTEPKEQGFKGHASDGENDRHESLVSESGEVKVKSGSVWEIDLEVPKNRFESWRRIFQEGVQKQNEEKPG